MVDGIFVDIGPKDGVAIVIPIQGHGRFDRLHRNNLVKCLTTLLGTVLCSHKKIVPNIMFYSLLVRENLQSISFVIEIYKAQKELNGNWKVILLFNCRNLQFILANLEIKIATLKSTSQMARSPKDSVFFIIWLYS